MMWSQVRSFAQRLALSTAGPMSVAAANFVVSLLLLGHVPAADFGLYAFIQVLVIAGYSLSNAIFGLPLTIVLNRNEQHQDSALDSFSFVNAIASFLGAAILLVLLIALGVSKSVGIAFAISAFLLWLRFFGRCVTYAIHRPELAATSDFAYGLLLLCSVLVLWSRGELSLGNAALAQIAGALGGIALLGFVGMRALGRGLLSNAVAPYVEGYTRHGRHALAAVLSTEATVNAHSYIVTFMLGPSAFAPISAAALFFRPISLVLQSLTQIERPVLARMLSDGNRRAAWRMVSTIRATAICTWIATVSIVCAVIIWFLPKLVHEGQDVSAITASACAWAAIFLVQCFRGPETTLVQANGDFRSLSKMTLLSSVVIVPLTAVIALQYGAVSSLGGILLGELLVTALILRLARRSISAKELESPLKQERKLEASG